MTQQRNRTTVGLPTVKLKISHFAFAIQFFNLNFNHGTVPHLWDKSTSFPPEPNFVFYLDMAQLQSSLLTLDHEVKSSIPAAVVSHVGMLTHYVALKMTYISM